MLNNKEEIIPKPETDPNYQTLLNDVGSTLEQGRRALITAANVTTVHTYWKIGQEIIEYEQKGKEKAEYGSELLKRLSRDLTDRYGKGFSHSNLIYIRKLYLTFPKSQTLSDKLSWSHYIELLKIEDPSERTFYLRECADARWGVRELKRQIDSMLYHRLLLSADKAEVLQLAQEGEIIEKPEDVLRDPYVFEFAGIPDKVNYLEGDL